MTTRRELLVASAAWPVLSWTGAALAQSKPPILIGWLSSGSGPGGSKSNFAAFKEGLAALGWKEGSNYVLEVRWAGLGGERITSLAQELAAKRPVLIVTSPSGGVAVFPTSAAEGEDRARAGRGAVRRKKAGRDRVVMTTQPVSAI